MELPYFAASDINGKSAPAIGEVALGLAAACSWGEPLR